MGQVLLEWKGHGHDLCNGLWEFLNQEYLVDLRVTCHGLCIKGHKLVLSVFFPYLRNQTEPADVDYLNGLQELNLDLVAEHAEDAHYLMEFVYTGKVLVPIEHTDCLYRIADVIGSHRLKESIRATKQNVIGENVEAKANERTGSQVVQFALKANSDNNERGTTCDREGATAQTSSAEQIENTAHPEHCSQKNDDDTKKRTYFRDYNRKRRILTCTICKYETRYPYRLKAHIKNKHKETSNVLESESSDDINVRPVIDCAATKNTTEIQDQVGDDPTVNVAVIMDSCDSQDVLLNNNKNLSEQEVMAVGLRTQVDEIEDQPDIPELKCPHCDYVGSKPYFLKRHLVCHSGKRAKRHACKLCKKVFGTSNMLRLHKESKCGRELPQKCKYCGHQTLRKIVLLQHMAVKHKVDGDGNPLKKNVQCPQCNFICFAKHQLQRHFQAKHACPNKYKCEECNYTAPFRSEMSKHVRIRHQLRRDYMCESCGFRSQTSCGLARHAQRVHENIKPHRCDVCGAEYCDSTSFKLHREKHDGLNVRRFVCHVCGQTFLRRSHLQTHCRCKHNVDLGPAKPSYDFVKNMKELTSEDQSATILSHQDGQFGNDIEPHNKCLLELS